MATQSISTGNIPSSSRNLSISRLAATGGVSMALIFVLCWIGTFIPFFSPTHAFIPLFTRAEMQSVTALIEGGVWALLFGLVVGAIVALVYNLFAGLDRARVR